MRVPSRASSAGSATTAETAEATATIIPARPIEEMAGMGKSSRQPSAAVTVAALKRTVRPAVVSVRASAAAPGPPLATSSRYRETISRLKSMLSPIPSAYTRLRESTETSATREASSSPSVVRPMLTRAPTRGRSPATTLPKMSSSSTSRMGIAIVSAKLRSRRLWSLPWASRAVEPPSSTWPESSGSASMVAWSACTALTSLSGRRLATTMVLLRLLAISSGRSWDQASTIRTTSGRRLSTRTASVTIAGGGEETVAGESSRTRRVYPSSTSMPVALCTATRAWALAEAGSS